MSGIDAWLDQEPDEEREETDEEEFVAKLRDDPLGWLDEEVAARQGIAGGGDQVRRQYHRGKRRRR